MNSTVNYMSAGTVEFIVDAEGRHYFIEMNTRIQVEHPVTEMVTGIDLVREQIRIADGEGLGYRQDAVRFEGHAIECRINAEDPETFAPSAGRITAWVPPGGFNVRVDSHLMAPYSVPPFYDSLLAKVIVRGANRAEAIGRMRRALAETIVEGVKTSIPFHLKVLNDPAFLRAVSPASIPSGFAADGPVALRHPRPRRGAGAGPRGDPGRGTRRRLPHDSAPGEGVAGRPAPAAGRAAARALPACGRDLHRERPRRPRPGRRSGRRPSGPGRPAAARRTPDRKSTR